MSVAVTFIDPRGDRVETTGEVGDNLLRVGQAAGLPLEGTCEGQMACSTCHVIVAAEWFEKLGQASEEEEDMLDFAYQPDPATSRLTCQLKVTDALDGLIVRMPEKQV